MCWLVSCLTHWGRVTHICVGNLTIIGSDNGLLPGRPQAIIWTSATILLIGPLGTNFGEILIGIQTFSFKEMHLKLSSAKGCLFGLSLNGFTGAFIVFISCYSFPSLLVKDGNHSQTPQKNTMFICCFFLLKTQASWHMSPLYKHRLVTATFCWA